MRPHLCCSSRAGADGPANLLAAITTAASSTGGWSPGSASATSPSGSYRLRTGAARHVRVPRLRKRPARTRTDPRRRYRHGFLGNVRGARSEALLWELLPDVTALDDAGLCHDAIIGGWQVTRVFASLDRLPVGFVASVRDATAAPVLVADVLDSDVACVTGLGVHTWCPHLPTMAPARLQETTAM